MGSNYSSTVKDHQSGSDQEEQKLMSLASYAAEMKLERQRSNNPVVNMLRESEKLKRDR